MALVLKRFSPVEDVHSAVKATCSDEQLPLGNALKMLLLYLIFLSLTPFPYRKKPKPALELIEHFEGVMQETQTQCRLHFVSPLLLTCQVTSQHMLT